MGLFRRIKATNLIRSVWTQMAQITVICALVSAIGTSRECDNGDYSGLMSLTYASVIVAAIAFIGWLIWAAYVVCSNRKLKPMQKRGYRILYNIDFCLIAYWILISFVPAATGGWILPVMCIVWAASLSIAIKYKGPEDPDTTI